LRGKRKGAGLRVGVVGKLVVVEIEGNQPVDEDVIMEVAVVEVGACKLFGRLSKHIMIRKKY
jgi:hypothetical protein